MRELSRHSMDPEVLALIRWFRIPVLAEDASSVRYKMQGAVHKAPLEFLAAWLANKGLPNGLSGSGCDEGVRGVVRHFLWGWADRPGVVEKMAPLFAESCGAAPGDIGRAIREMADTCPPLLWAWRYRLPITRAQEVLKYLHEERLKLESPADWRAVMRRARVPERAAAMISTSLEARDLGRVVESDDVRQLGESRKGRAALSALILETVVKLRTEEKD